MTMMMMMMMLRKFFVIHTTYTFSEIAPAVAFHHVHLLKFSCFETKEKDLIKNGKFKSHAIYHTCFLSLTRQTKSKNERRILKIHTYMCDRFLSHTHIVDVFLASIYLFHINLYFPIELYHKYKLSHTDTVNNILTIMRKFELEVRIIYEIIFFPLFLNIFF